GPSSVLEGVGDPAFQRGFDEGDDAEVAVPAGVAAGGPLGEVGADGGDGLERGGVEGFEAEQAAVPGAGGGAVGVAVPGREPAVLGAVAGQDLEDGPAAAGGEVGDGGVGPPGCGVALDDPAQLVASGGVGEAAVDEEHRGWGDGG